MLSQFGKNVIHIFQNWFYKPWELEAEVIELFRCMNEKPKLMSKNGNLASGVL